MTTPALSSDLSFARLVSAKGSAKASGLVTATRGRLRRVFCLEQGWFVFAASNLIEEQLDEYLVRNGMLAPATRAAAAAAAGKARQAVLARLIEERLVDDADLRKGMEGLVRSLVSSCLEWPDGEYRFDSGRPNLDGKITVRMSPVQLFLAHARRHPASLDAVRVRLGPPDALPKRTPTGDALKSSLETGAASRFLLQACDGSTALGDLLEASPAGPDETLRALYGLVLAGAVDTRTARAPVKTSREEAPLTEEECLAVLKRAENADHYGVLGLDRRATRDQIRAAYYSLARRYHPDRFRAGALAGFIAQMEAYFTQVTEAYNTLFHAELRGEYDRMLAEDAPKAESAASTTHLARQNFLRARDLIERRRLAEAATYLENAIQQDDSEPEYHLELGRLLSGNPRRRADAEEHLLRAAQLDPSSPAAYVALGHLYRKAAREADAARMFREALRWEPSHVEAARQLEELGDAAEATSDGGILRHLFRSG